MLATLFYNKLTQRYQKGRDALSPLNILRYAPVNFPFIFNNYLLAELLLFY